MLQAFRRRLILSAAIALQVAAANFAAALADDRSVTIIEGAPEPVQPPQPKDVHGKAGEPLRTVNPAGVSLQLLPGPDLAVGTNVAFRIGVRRPGYLVLVDINASGAVTQIYPNVMSLTRAPTSTAANLIKPGTTVTIPDLKNPLARFTFRTEPPVGQGIIVAILSEQPVQLIDLPELPPDLASSQASVDYLDKAIRSLLVSRTEKPGAFNPGTWSLAAVDYAVK